MLPCLPTHCTKHCFSGSGGPVSQKSQRQGALNQCPEFFCKNLSLSCSSFSLTHPPLLPSLLSLSLSLPISTPSPLCVDYSTCLLNIQQNESSLRTLLLTVRAIAADQWLVHSECSLFVEWMNEWPLPSFFLPPNLQQTGEMIVWALREGWGAGPGSLWQSWAGWFTRMPVQPSFMVKPHWTSVSWSFIFLYARDKEYLIRCLNPINSHWYQTSVQLALCFF